MLKHTLVLGATAAMHGGASAQTLSLNLADALAPVKAKMAAGQTSRIVVIGDSLAYRAGTWLPEFRAHLQSEHGDAGLGFMDFSLWSGGSFGAGWTFGLIGSDTSPHRSLTGMWSLSPPTAGVASYAAGSAKSLTLMIAGEPGAGSATIQAPGQSPVVVDGSSPTNVLRTGTVSGPNALNSVSFSTSGPATLLGVVLESGQPGVFVHRVANGGWGVNNYLQRDWTFDVQLAALNPDLVYIWLGQNDQGTPQATYETKMSQLVDRVLADVPTTKVVLVGTWNAGGTAIPVLVQAMQSVAAARSLGFINVFAAGGPYEFYFDSGYLDGYHFSPSGGVYVGQLMYDAFVTDGADFCDPHVWIQPSACTAPVGYPASFYARACAGTGETYRWRRDGVDVFDDGRITGAATQTLSISSTGPGDAGLYDLVVSGPCGSATSHGAPLTVIPACPSDFNHDGFVTGEDFDQFVDLFINGDQAADFNGDTFVSGEDFDEFVDAYVAGC